MGLAPSVLRLIKILVKGVFNMKKISAKVLSFILMAALILSFAPSVMAEGEVVLPTGNAEGRLTDGLTVSYGNGADNMTPTELLTDGFHYSTAERMACKVRPQADTTRMIELTGDNRFIDFSWNEEKNVKRLEMWIWRVGAVKDYKIWVSENGTEWSEHTTGSFDQTHPVPLDSDTKGGAAIFYLAQFDNVRTRYLRFEVTAFREGQASAHIAEAIPRSSDVVNLLGDSTLSTSHIAQTSGENGKTPWMKYNKSSYAFGYALSASRSPFNTTPQSTGHSTCETWPMFGSGYPCMVLAPASGKDYAFYTTSFLASPQTINRVGVKVYAGTVKNIEVYYSTATTWPTENSETWTKCAEANGVWSSANPATIDIPEAPKAEFWKVKLNSVSSDLMVYPIEMYSLYGDVSLFGKGASFGNGANESVLSDGEHYFFYNPPADRTPSANLDKLAKFTSVDSGIMFKLSETVKRLDLWILSHGGIKDYEIQTSADGLTWETHQSGSFTKYDTVVAENDTKASYYPVVLENPVNSKYMRFVIKSFYDNSKGAYISEAQLYNHNNIDFTKQGVYGTGKGKINYSPYVTNYYLTQGKSTMTGFTKGNLTFFPADTDGNIKPIMPDENACWYVTDFYRSKVKVNRVGINISAGTISEFEVWACVPDGKTSASWGGTNDLAVDPLLAGNASLWQRVGKISCNLSKSTNDLTFDLPRSIEANAWMIRPTVYSSNLYIPSVEMYSVAQSELGAVVEAGTITVAGDTLTAGSEVTYTGYSYNSNYPNAAVFFALYSGDTLVEVSRKPMAISGTTHSATYTIPATAGDNLSLKAFLWDGITLAPILSNPVTK